MLHALSLIIFFKYTLSIVIVKSQLDFRWIIIEILDPMVIFTITNHLINHDKPFDQGEIQKV
jgi:NADH:ubiquinone oxidoreductase subunit H